MENKWKDAIINAMKSYNMDTAHYDDRPDDALCDLLYMHTNAEVHRAMMNHYTNEGDKLG